MFDKHVGESALWRDGGETERKRERCRMKEKRQEGQRGKERGKYLKKRVYWVCSVWPQKVEPGPQIRE